MKGRMAGYIEENRRVYKYYSYVPGGKWGHMLLSIGTLCGISTIVFLTRMQFLRQHFLRQATREDLGRQEVSIWVEAQIASRRWDRVSVMLIGLTILVGLWIIFVYQKVKSYDLYKKQGWYILPPVAVYGAAAVVIICFSEPSSYSPMLAIQIFIEISPILSAFKLFLPLDLREGFGILLNLFDWMSQIVIKRL